MNTKTFGLIAVLLIVVVVGLVGIGSMVSAGGPEDIRQTPYQIGDVKALIQLSGNDILVTIVDESKVRKVSSIYVYYEHDPVSRCEMNTCNDVKIGETITFANMAKGKNDMDSIIVEAVFADKTTEKIGTTYISFI